MKELEDSVRSWLRDPGAPRRLVVALPPGAVVEPVTAAIAHWVDPDAVALHTVGGQPGGGRPGGLDWRMDMHRRAVVLGPADALVSRALNRGQGTHRDLWPVEFALLTNGAHWIVTDPDRCPQSTVTLGRLVGFARHWPTAEPLRLTALVRPAPPTTTLIHPPGDAAALAASARRRHRAGDGPTLLVVPGLAEARAAHAALGGTTERTLLHPYYRPADRARVVARLAIADQIVVATEAAAAGVRAAVRLTATTPRRPARRLSRVDLADVRTWFDTRADESTVDDYVLDDGGEAHVAFAHWTPVDASGRPPSPLTGARVPDATARCRAPLAEVRALAARTPVWRFDPAAEGFTAIGDGAPPRPGEVLLAAAGAGGYDPATGVDAAATAPVPDCPSLDPVPAVDPVDGTGWLALDRHSTDVRDQVGGLLVAIDPDLPPGVRDAVATAGYAHDAGKWHPVWQDALCALARDDERERVVAGRPWAKSGIEGRLQFADGARFRHELASLMLLDGPLRGVLAGAEDPDLVRYLVLAHHGKLRLRVDPADRGVVPGRVTATPAMFGQPAAALSEDVTAFLDGSWTRTVEDLLARHGPFRLAYLETLVRMADWRASAGRAPADADAAARRRPGRGDGI